MSRDTAQSIGVLGAGTMGAGIALTALRSGESVVLSDVSPEALDRAQDYIHKQLERKGQQGRADDLTCTTELSPLAGCGVVIEAALEELKLKQRLFAELDRLCPPPAILVSNTSTLSITALAAATETPERVAGMHFFNPAPVMALVEVARGAATAPDTIDALVQLAERWGKTAVVTRDTPGFIVNRVARPFYGEALRLLGEGAADHWAIDTVIKLGAGFRMGPFELMDLIGIDVNFAAAHSIYQASFQEPRFRPHWIQQQKVSQGELGRKTGRGYYEYVDGERQADEPQPPDVAGGAGEVLLSEGSWAPGLKELLERSGYAVVEGSDAPMDETEAPAAAVVTAGADESIEQCVADFDRRLPAAVPILCQTVDSALSALAGQIEHPGRLIGFDGLFAAGGRVMTLSRSAQTDATAQQRADELARSLGRLPVWIEESPAMVAPRVVCCLANEAAFAAGERVAEPGQIDLATRLGLNYPRGPLAWAAELGYARAVAVLDHLRAEFGEERYRAAPLLRRWARNGRP